MQNQLTGEQIDELKKKREEENKKDLTKILNRQPSSKRRVSHRSERTVVNENGEYSKTIDKTTTLEREPGFVKLYLDNILLLNNIPKTSNGLLYALLQRLGYNNQLVLNAALKRQISAEIGLTVKTIDNSISQFVKNEILIRMDRGLYIANPHLFGRGEWKNISEIRMHIAFNKANPTGKVTTEFVQEGEEDEN